MRPQWRRPRLAASAVMASVLASTALAACSTGSSAGSSAVTGSGGAGASRQTGTTRGVTDSSVTVGGLAPLTSATGATLPGSDIGARAEFDKVNAAGGVYGRKIDFIGVTDDGGDPTKNLDAARQLVEQRQVFAVVPVITPELGSASFLQDHRVPTVGELYDTLACHKSYLFGLNGCTSPPASERVYSPGVGLVLKQGVFHGQNGKTVAVTLDDSEVGHASVQQCAGPFEATGFKVVTDDVFLPVAPPVTDYGPFVQRLLVSSNGKPPDVIWPCNGFPIALGLIGAAKVAGYGGVVYSPVTYDPRLLAVPALRDALQGSYVYTLFSPSEATTTSVERVKSDIHSVDPNAQLSVPVLAGYLAAEMFVDILRAAGPHLTAERFAAAGNRDFTFTGGGNVCPVTFPLAHDEGMVGGGLVQVQGSQFKVVVPLLCEPMSANVHY